MARRGGFILAILGGVTLVGGAAALRTLLWTGDLFPVHPQAAMSCAKVEGLPGAEDLVIDRNDGVAFFSVCNRADAKGFDNPQGCAGPTGENNATRGAIYVMDVNAPASPSIDITGGVPRDFHPHGIDFWEGPDGEKLLFVVNHANAGERVEIYEVNEDLTLTHMETAVHELIVSPNDVAATGSRSFYVTNDMMSERFTVAEQAELVLRRDLATLVYWDAGRAVTARRGLSMPNGVALSRDGSKLYLAETLDGRLTLLSRNLLTSTLRSGTAEQSEMRLNTGLDNIDVDEQGFLWIGAHPQLLRFQRHFDAPDQYAAPSQVLVVDPLERRAGLVYASPGSEDGAAGPEHISGATVAARFGDRVLIGSVLDDHVLVCTLDEVWQPWDRAALRELARP